MKGKVFLAIALAVGLTVLLHTMLTEPPARAQGECDRWVLQVDGSDSGDCSDETAPCATIQYAIDQAADGETICVAKHTLAGPLTYQETLVITKSVTLDGAWDAMCVDPSNLTCSFTAIPCDPANVTIDALGAGRVISISGSINPTIRCFTITGGDAAGQGGDPGNLVDNDAGGGIYSRDAAPIIIHNVIIGNYGCDTCPASYGRGGGIYLLNAPSTAVISGNSIAYNVADETSWGQGGGIMLRNSDAQVLSNTIEHNRAGHSAGYGGGIAVRDGAPIIADNALAFNYGGQSVQGLGGGIYVWSTTPAIIEGNELRYNQALHGSGDPTLFSAGGGIYYAGTITNPVSAVIRDNFLEWNLGNFGGSLSGDGGGIYLRYLTPASIVEGNVLEWNRGSDSFRGRGGGIYVADSELTIEDNEFTHNTAVWSGSHGEGGGLYVDGGTVLIAGNVISANTGSYFPGLPSTATGNGGGIAAAGGQTTIRDNTIANNGGTNGDSLGLGGGIFSHGGTLNVEFNTIASNYASILDVGYGGGGMISNTIALVRGNLITGNQATSDTIGAGGGLYILSETVRIEANTIAGNQATLATWGFGGGLYLDQTEPWLDSNIILNNTADNGTMGIGGGVRIGLCPVFTLTNNIVAANGASNTGSGVAIAGDGAGVLVHNTIVENQVGDGVGVHVESGSDVALTNNIVISHWQGIANADPAGSIVTATHTLFQGNGADYGPDVTSVNEIPGPAALLPNYHLGNRSNAIANALPLSWITHDVDGDARPYRGGPDVGADEVSCLAHVVGGGGVYFSIQAAVDVAASGHTVRVAEGTCYENVAITESLTLEGGWDQAFTTRSADPATATTIDGLGRGRAISITELSGAIAPVIDGFTLTGGDATDLGGSDIYGYDIGGGLYSWYADTTVSDSIIQGNVASTNDIGWGGGLGFYHGNPTVIDCLIEDNVASTASNGYGGGVYFRYGLTTLQDTIIRDNVASTIADGRGGGVASHFSNLTMERNVVWRNTANADPARSGYGGGVYLNCTTGPEMTNNVVAHNRLTGNGNGSGLFLYDTNLRLLHTTLANNTGGAGQGMYALAGATVEMTNTILAGHTVGVHAFGTGTTIELEATLGWDNGTWALATDGGAVTLKAPSWEAMPDFVDAEDGDYHLQASSPAVNAGLPLPGVDLDRDSNPRPDCVAWDIGAYETQGLPCWSIDLPLILRSG